MPVDRDVEAGYLSGLQAVRTITATFSDADWDRPACGTWTATDLAGHLVTVISWYHDWLDRAQAGDATPAFAAAELDTRTGAALDRLPDGRGPDRIDEFGWRAAMYRTRVHGNWDRPFGYPRGTVTAGLHLGLAAWEWHVHAWDLATAIGEDHRPDEPDALYRHGIDCIETATGAAMPVTTGDPWAALLRRTGRTP